MKELVDYVQRRASPQTLKFAATATLLSLLTVHLLQNVFINVPVTSAQQFPPSYLPDICWRGYTLLELAAWFTSIGRQGRLIYFLINVLDFGVVIPSYVVALESVIALTECPVPFYYLPLLVAACDAVETFIFVAANVMFPRLFIKVGIIRTASRATQTKYALLALSLVGILFHYVRRNKHSLSQKLLHKKN
jgi:hypothetical protein